MISCEGGFGWHEHALTGRPDFLNYLHAGDVTWEGLWQFYREHPAPHEAVRSLMRLFHAFHSSVYDAAGCWLDPDGDLLPRLRDWAEFTLDSTDSLPMGEVQADLAGLIGANLATPLYYRASYFVWMECSVDRLARAWQNGQVTQVSELEAPDGHILTERCLPPYHPEADRFPQMRENPTWVFALQILLDSQYAAWNGAYATCLGDLEEEEDWTAIGGES